MKALIKTSLFLTLATTFSCGPLLPRAQFATTQKAPTEDSRGSTNAQVNDAAGIQTRTPGTDADSVAISSKGQNIASSAGNQLPAPMNSNPNPVPGNPLQPNPIPQPISPNPLDPSSGSGSNPSSGSTCGLISNGTPSYVLADLTLAKVSNPSVSGMTHVYVVQDGTPAAPYDLNQIKADFPAWKADLAQLFLQSGAQFVGVYFGRIDQVKITCVVAN